MQKISFVPNMNYRYRYYITLPTSKSEIWKSIRLICEKTEADLVAAAVAIVGGGEDGDHVPVVGPVVALHHQLVGPAHGFHASVSKT
jgi:hypothetical protein